MFTDQVALAKTLKNFDRGSRSPYLTFDAIIDYYESVKNVSNALIDVTNERKRQIEAEGWNAKHDDDHKAGVLASAGASYALNAADEMYFGDGWVSPEPPPWPWASSWWKPKGARRDLVRAAALLLAEIERIDRNAVDEEIEP